MSKQNTEFDTSDVRSFGIRDKVGYMFGDFGNDFSFLLATAFLMLFWTDSLGASAAIGGTIMAAARVVDAFTDVGMGLIVDRSKERKAGKFRPWIARGMFPVAIASFFMYMPFAADFSNTGKIVYMTVTYLLWGSITYTMINIPYGSMAAVISPEAEDRANLSVFRSVGAGLAQLIVTVSIPLFVNVTINGQSTFSGPRMTIAAGICAALSVVCYYICYSNVRERVHVPSKAEQRAELEASGAEKKNLAAALLTSRPLITLILAAILLLFGSLMAMQLANYLWKDYFNNFTLASAYNFVAAIPVFILAPFAAKISSKWGKKEVSAVVMAFSGVVYLLLYFVKIPRSQPFIFIAIVFFGLLAVAVFNLIIWAFITDVIDAEEVRTHSRDDATVYAVYSWARKLGQALAALISGWALAWVGYSSTLAQAKKPQSIETQDGIYMLTTLVPGIIYILVALTLWFLYPLGKKTVEANIAELKRRREAREAKEAKEAKKS